MPLTLEHINYIYGEGTPYEIKALDDVSLTIPDGQFAGIIGHTGSGKSTLIQLFNGLEKPTSGKVMYNGENIWEEGYDRRQLKFNVGLVFQYPEHQLFESTVIKDVCFGPLNKGLSQEEANEKALAALKSVGLSEDTYERSPFELSGGQKRRAAIAGILAMEPKFMILDEPTAGLDPKGRTEILDMINALQDNNGMGVVLVSHSMEDVARYTDRLIVMDHGRKAYDGTPKEVFRKYTELEKIGLSAPQITYLCHELKSRGFNVDEDAVTVEAAKASILKALKENR